MVLYPEIVEAYAIAIVKDIIMITMMQYAYNRKTNRTLGGILGSLALHAGFISIITSSEDCFVD